MITHEKIKRAVSFSNTDDGLSLTVDDRRNGFMIQNIDGIYAFTGDVVTTPYSYTDGSHYQLTRAPQRNVVVTGVVFENFNENRQLMYRIFRLKSRGRFAYMEPDYSTRYIDYYVESVEISQERNIASFQISLICADPFFYGDETSMVELAAWENDFEFEHEFLAAGEELGHREASMIKEISNINGVSGIGMDITLTSIGNVTNPYVYIDTGERITLGTEDEPFVLSSDMTVNICTLTGQKDITKTVGGITTRINEVMDPLSSFFQLGTGVNTIGYNAASGAEYMSVTIKYRMRYLGV